MDASIDWLLKLMALPEYGLSTVFVIAFIAAPTPVPFASGAAVFGLAKRNPGLLWPATAVATAGGTLGGALTGWMGFGAERAYERVTHWHPDSRALRWLQRHGAKACLRSWLPIVGDPLRAVAGSLELPFRPCVGYAAIGKFARYHVLTAALLWLFPGQYAH